LFYYFGKKNPELMKGLGSGIKEFKNAAKDGQPADKKEEEIKKKAFHNLKSLLCLKYHRQLNSSSILIYFSYFY
jgi:sec-independent protein translocase protein TatA